MDKKAILRTVWCVLFQIMKCFRNDLGVLSIYNKCRFNFDSGNKVFFSFISCYPINNQIYYISAWVTLLHCRIYIKIMKYIYTNIFSNEVNRKTVPGSVCWNFNGETS